MGPSHQKRGPLCPGMGRPCCGVAGTFSATVLKRIDQLRPGLGGWGAITLRVELELDQTLADHSLPSVRSINSYLKNCNRVRPYRPPCTLPDTQLVLGQFPHDVWQLDAEGNKPVPDLGSVAMLNIKDTFSKAYVQSYPLVLATPQNHPKKADYQRVVRLGWMEFGLNNCLQLDHESIFFDNTHPSPFPTPLCLWLIGMGSHIIYTPGGKPFKQGAVERSHQTMDRQVCQNKIYADHSTLFATCQARRKRLNFHIPCRNLKGQAPLKAHPSAKHSTKYYNPAIEHKIFDVEKIYQYLAQCKPWYRKVTDNRTIGLGTKQYSLRLAQPRTEVAIRFDLQTKCFIFEDDNQKAIACLKPKGIDHKDLAGDIQAFMAWAKTQNSIEIARPNT